MKQMKQKFVQSLYDFIGSNSRMPEAANEIVLVVDEYNRLDQSFLESLGISGADKKMKLTDLTILYKLDSFIDKKLKEYFFKDELAYLQKNIKSFSRAHYESKYNLNNSKYFFQPDTYNTEEQKLFLEDTYNLNILKDETSENIDKLFHKYVYKKVKEENEDVLHGMS